MGKVREGSALPGEGGGRGGPINRQTEQGKGGLEWGEGTRGRRLNGTSLKVSKAKKRARGYRSSAGLAGL